MKKKSLLISLLFMAITSIAQEVTKEDAAKLQEAADNLKTMKPDTVKPWKLGGLVAFNGQQVSLTNWAAGGNNSISLGGLVNVFANYRHDKSTWDNSLELGYGVIKQGNNKKWWKNDDKIQITSKYGRHAYKKWYYSALADFRTQFANGYNYPNDSIYISKLMAPAYGLLAMGFDYKPNDNFTIFISPLTGKFTIVNDDSLARIGAFGVQKEIKDPANGGTITQQFKNHREEFGGYFKMGYKTKVMENITFQTVLELFCNYLHNPQNVDVNWTTLTTLKVNKFISATVSTQLIYDDDIKLLRNVGSEKGTVGPDVQFKQVLGVGLNYKF